MCMRAHQVDRVEVAEAAGEQLVVMGPEEQARRGRLLSFLVMGTAMEVTGKLAKRGQTLPVATVVLAGKAGTVVARPGS